MDDKETRPDKFRIVEAKDDNDNTVKLKVVKPTNTVVSDAQRAGPSRLKRGER